MPALGLGTWKAAPGEVGRAVREAIRIGYRHIDCASIYGNEAEIGEALSSAIDEGLVRREDLWITSKLWCNAHAREDVVPAARRSLEDLRLEALDLYLVHWPIGVRRDVVMARSASDFATGDDVALAETWRGMEEVAELGLARAIGVSNFSARKLRDVAASARRRPEVDQVEVHPYLQQRELLAACAAEGVAVTGYSPLGSPDRPAGMKRSDEVSLLEDPVIAEIAAQKGASPAQVLIAWQLHLGLSVIPKSVDPTRLRENLEAERLRLDESDLDEIRGLERGERYVTGSFWVLPGGPHTLASLWDE